MFRTLVSAIGIVALAAAGLVGSAEAASKHKKRHAQSGAATAQSAKRAPAWSGGAAGTGPLYNGQDYLGDDPDPFIRFSINRDLGARYGGEP